MSRPARGIALVPAAKQGMSPSSKYTLRPGQGCHMPDQGALIHKAPNGGYDQQDAGRLQPCAR